ncbi:phosphoribosylanthranilate isomerase [Natronogracilivirga saccharolytica]|uniref:N-(5'-phosphoribosyl)anthranilate isomerase n=1 Tax=Natronogracilivirga saccharolytica TaxID=2812953 RepID=A0A8J7S8S8_9BACT|nr:phosphoribosylanthranilate isomerase [Natronogracilivirga saccharolytica]MBP3192413.1 phosphoribosylanthranilate isomerase [Natronogracilivirga saccharolytica]
MFEDQQQPKLKICGITSLEDARFAAGALVDYLGFIFYPGSARYISPRNASEIISWIEGPKCVGVFVNQPADEINKVIKKTNIDLVQLHGDESPGFARSLDRPVIKAFRVKGPEQAGELSESISEWEDVAEYFLFDAHHDQLYGGTGSAWDWSIVNKLGHSTPFFLAGGINDENLKEAVSQVSPFGIDLSSSLEESPGVKDFDKIQSFVDVWNDLQ